MIGRTIQHYEIVETLGRGGMGVVYKAKDTHLDRFVAIKVLPPEKVADPERKRRFVQEAKAASALNHPNIVHIYDIAEADGIQFIAMEYVPGKTLDQLIGRKGLRLNEALKYAVQIADALAQAHSAGIIHRDLKPSNIMVSGAGLVKVLDFGLAKLTETATGEFLETATIRAQEDPSTEEGTIVGTVAYMSPEQAEGKKLDARSDIFSFGSLLYEMVTGRRAFQGQTKVSTLSVILHQEPKAASEIAEETPHELERIIARCLRKNPDRRFQHTADLKVALEELKEESGSGSAVAPIVARRRRWFWRVAVPGSIVVAGVAVWVLARSGGTPEAPLVPVPLTTYPGNELAPSFSPDGNQVAFAWSGPSQDNYDIYVKLVGTGPVRLTSDPADDISPAWSPDGRFIAFLRILSNERTAIFLIPAIGGAERKLVEVSNFASPESGPYLSWFPDGRWLATIHHPPGKPSAVFLVSVEDGEKKRLTAPPPNSIGDQNPAISPDGRTLVFSRSLGGQTGDLYRLELSGNLSPKDEPKRLTFDNASLGSAWTADGRSIVFTSGSYQSPSLWKIDLAQLRWRNGKAERLSFAGQDVRQPAISRNGRLAYARYPVNTNLWRLDLGGGGKSSVPGMRVEKAAIKLNASTRSDFSPAYSPDGKRIAFASNRSGSHEIWVCNSDGSNAVQLTSFGGPFFTANPRWSPDGLSIFLKSAQEGHEGWYVISYEGGRPKRLAPEDLVPAGWSRDGKWIYFESNRSGEDQLWRMPWPTSGHGEGAVQVTRKGGGTDVVESPDGRFAFYLKYSESDIASVWKVAVKGGEEAQVLESVLNGNFAGAGQGIYFIPDSKPRSLRFYSFSTGKVVSIADIPQRPAWGLSVSPDGHWLVYTASESIGSDLMLVENFR